ncbi:MAG: hypothetical protein LBF40_00740, partial [Deltaproteobacteria bacterium]|nr:hypothetical protein [Deltaproteobacteria bacterium]
MGLPNGKSYRKSVRAQKNHTTIPIAAIKELFMVHGSWFMVLGSWFLVPGSWFLGPSHNALVSAVQALSLKGLAAMEGCLMQQLMAASAAHRFILPLLWEIMRCFQIA